MQIELLRRANRFEVDLDAIGHNLGEVRRIVGDSVQVFAALKANAYGFGLVEVADAALSAGADALAVADASDAVRLRRHGVEAPILLYPGSLPTPEVVAAAEAHALILSVHSRESARGYAELAARRIRVFVKVDVGMERLGIPASEAVGFIEELGRAPKLELGGLYTHIDVPARPGAERYITWQYERFDAVCAELARRGLAVPIMMAASSAVLRFSPAMRMTAVDPGHLLFGFAPTGPATVSIDLRPAFRALKSRLIQVRHLDRAEYVEWSPVGPRAGARIGVIPIGLRDGMANLNCGEVLVRGRRVPIVGGLSLEHTRVDLTAVPDAAVGDEAVVVGSQSGGRITPDEVIARQGFAVKAELALAVRDSVPRFFIGSRHSADSIRGEGTPSERARDTRRRRPARVPSRS